jgi:hypothetical protein
VCLLYLRIRIARRQRHSKGKSPADL